MNSPIKNKKYFLNKLSKEKLDYIDIIGLNVALVYSKDQFKKNTDISIFLKEVYNINFLPYVLKSRTLIVARLSKEISQKSENELISIKNKLISYLEKNSDSDDTEKKHKKTSKRKDSNEKLKSWLEGL